MGSSITRYYEAVDSAGSKVALEKARNVLQNQFRNKLRGSFLSAFRRGAQSRGFKKSISEKLAEEMYPGYMDLIDTQCRFANQFIGELSQGALNQAGRMSVGARLNMYANAITSAYHAGSLSAGPPDELIFWRLGSCDHCTDCPVLAASGPYNRNTLPTLPGQGQTTCRTNCCCYLEFVPGKAAAKPPEDLMDRWVKGPAPRPGFNTPDPEQLARLRDLENRKNYLRRKIASETDAAKKKLLISQRRGLQAEIRKFADSKKLMWSPEFSVGEVINGGNITRKDMDSIFLRGIDGTTVSRADVQAVDQMLRDSSANLMRSSLDYGLSLAGGIPAY